MLLNEEIQKAYRECASVAENINALQRELMELRNSLARLRIRASRGGRTINRTAAAASGTIDCEQDIDASITEKEREVEQAQEAHSIKEEEKQRCEQLMNAWTVEFRYRTVDDLVGYGKARVQPALTYYLGLFLKRNGDLFRFCKAIKATKIFDPFVLAVLPLESLAEMIDELSHFQYPEFNQEFLDGKKKEDPSAVSDTRQILTGIVRKFLICRRLVFRKI